MRLLQKHYHGFTLIELLVTTAIAAIVVGGGIAGFIGFTDRQEVLNTAKEVQQLMRTAQSKARVRDVPDVANCNNPYSLSYFQIILNVPGKVTMTPVCTGGAVPTSASIDVTFPSGVVMSKNQTYTSISIMTLERGILQHPPLLPPLTPNPIAETTLTFTKGSNAFYFTLSPVGKISNVEKVP